jgi:putative membrane protein
MDFLYIKALHIIFVVCWFAGLFYIVRLFIYQTEANQKTEAEKNVLVPQFQMMQKRLWYGITWPSAILTMVFGFWMYFLNFDYYLHQPWMMLKLFFVGVLFIYQLRCQVIFNKMKTNSYTGKSFGLRLFNEVATILLFAIVFLVTVKSTGSLVWGGLGLVILTAVIMTATFIYKKKREKGKEENL